MGGGMGGGIDKQQQMASFYTQSTKIPVQHQQMQKSTGTSLSKLTGGKSEKTEESKSKSDDKFVGSSDGEAEEADDGKASQLGGAVVGSFLKSRSKDRKANVGRRLVSDGEVAEDSEVDETEETSSVNKTNMGLIKKSTGNMQIAQVSAGRRKKEGNHGISDFIDDWLKIKRSPAAKLGLGDIMVEQGKENSVEPFILLSIAASETDYGKKEGEINGLLGIDYVEGPEEQIVEGARLFSELRESGESSLDEPAAKQILAVNRAGWINDMNWHKSVFKYYQEIKRAWERYSEMVIGRGK